MDNRKSNHHHLTLPALPRLILLLFVIIIPHNGVEAQLPDGFSEGLKALQTTTFWGDTLKGLYEVTDLYVGWISTEKFGPKLLKEFGIDINNVTITQFSNLSLPNLSDSSQILAFIGQIAKLIIAYLAHLIIGILLFLCLFICAFLLCCCRKAGCFCGKTGKKKKKSSDKAVIIILFIILLAVTVIIFLDGFAVAVGATTFSDNFDTKNNSNYTVIVDNVLTLIDQTFVYVEYLRNDALKLIDRKRILNLVDGVMKTLSGSILTGVLDGCPACNDFNRSLSTLTTSLNILKTNLDKSVSIINSLNISYTDLEASKTAITNKGSAAVAACLTPTCVIAGQFYSQFTVIRSAAVLPDLTTTQTTLNTFTNGPIGEALLLGPNGLFSNITDQLDSVTARVNSSLNDLESLLKTDLPITSAEIKRNSLLNTVNGYLSQASTYLKIIIPILASVIFIMVAMNVLGLLTVPFCASSKPSLTENIFLASSGTSFLTGSIYALLAAILFLVTCPIYGEFCIDFSKGSDSTYFGIADNLIKSLLKDNLGNMTNGLDMQLDYSKLNFIRSGVYGYCGNNESLANVVFDFANLDRNFTDSFIVKYAEPLIDSALPDTIDISQQEIFKDSTFKTINDTIDSLELLDMTPIVDLIDKLNDTITIPTIDQMIVQTNAASGQAGADSTSLNILSSTDLPAMETLANQVLAKEKELVYSINNFTQTLAGIPPAPSVADQMRNLTGNLKLLKDDLNAGAGVLALIRSNALLTTKTEFYKLVSYFKNLLLANFQCRPLYDIIESLIGLPCKSILRPLNALWLSLGSFSVLGIMSVVCGLWMSGLLVRQKKKDDQDALMENDEMEMKEDPRRKERRKERRNERRNERRRSRTPDRSLPPTNPLPPPPLQYQPQYRPPYEPSGPPPLVPPISVFPDGIYLNMPKFNASNEANKRKNRLPRQPYSQGDDNHRGQYANNSPTFLPPYDPFTNYQG